MTILAVAASGYTLLVATDAAQVRAAQQLRYEVFAEELGARLPRGSGLTTSTSSMRYCDHLVVRDERTGEVVGTYRMLPPHRAAEAGRRYADGEFDLAGLAPLRGQTGGDRPVLRPPGSPLRGR